MADYSTSRYAPMRRFHVNDLTTDPPTRDSFVVLAADAAVHEATLKARGPLVSWWSEAFWPADEDDRPEPLTLAEIAAAEGIGADDLRRALRESHPDASPSEVIYRAHNLDG